MAKKLYQVDEDFIRQAHEAACSQWKEKLEDKFPEVFEEHKVIQFIKKKIGKLEGRHIRMFVSGDCLAICLPNANTEWTFQVWDYVKKICAINTGTYECYPVHGPKYEEIIKKSPEWSADDNYQIVDIRAIHRML